MQGSLQKSPIVFCFAVNALANERIEIQSGGAYKILSSSTP